MRDTIVSVAHDAQIHETCQLLCLVRYVHEADRPWPIAVCQCQGMEQESALDEECLALESIFEDKFTRLQADKIRLVISAEGAEDDSSSR